MLRALRPHLWIAAPIALALAGGWASLGSLSAQDDAEAQRAERHKLLQTFMSELVEITPGEGKFPKTFQMGGSAESEAPVHEVSLTHPFAIAKYEVPQNLYQAVTGQNPSLWKGPRNAAEMFSWQEAQAFCAKLTMLLREAELIDVDEVIRLPSEAEWEYCCRAGTTTVYSFGDGAATAADAPTKARLLDPYGWHTGNAAGNDPPVGKLKPNPWGLYDMHGYLWEYTADEWHPTYADAPRDGSARGRPMGGQRVIRGGSWRDGYERLRSAAREPLRAEAKSDAVGLRCVKSHAAAR